jgi:class 3 adenylate cyclase
MQELIDELKSAKGESRSVVAVFVDVRGFTRFAGIAESSDAAIFLKKFYLATLQHFLPDATFAKPTGDGLMVIFEYEEPEVDATTAAALKGCIQLVTQYPAFLKDDPMILFELPPSIGIGVARGSATRLATNDGILDYFGRCLNLAARLMNVARPKGLVVDKNFFNGLSESPKTYELEHDAVHLAGITQNELWPIVANRAWTTIEDQARHTHPGSSG